MSRRRLIALVAVLTVPLASCSVAVTGSPRAASAVQQTTEDDESTQVTDDGEATETGDDTDSPTAPIAPTDDAGDSGSVSSESPAVDDPTDADSIGWLTSFCTAFTDIGQYTSPDTTGMTVDAALQTMSDSYSAMAEIATHAAQDLVTLPEPHFANHAQIVPAVASWFGAVAQTYAQGATMLMTTQFDTEDDIIAAVNEIEAGLDAPNEAIGTAMALLDQPTKDAMIGLPECASLTGG